MGSSLGAGRSARRLAVAAVVGALTITAAACGDDDDSSDVCEEYADVAAARAELDGADFSQATASTASQLLASYRQSVLKMQDDDDGTYTVELRALEKALDDALATFDTVDDTASADTWGPVLEDDLQAVRDASANVDASVGADCASG